MGDMLISTLPKSVTMKIKAPTFADLFAETSPQLGGARRTKFLAGKYEIFFFIDVRGGTSF